MSVRVAVAGAAGRMGRNVVRAVHEDPGTELAAAIDVTCGGEDAGALAGVGPAGVSVRSDLEAALESSRAEVLVDFTRAEAAYENALASLRLGVSPVIGTTGMSAAQVAELRS